MISVAAPLALAVITALPQEHAVVHGRVVDSAGKPAARVIVSPCWSFPDPHEKASETTRPQPAPELASTSTDDQGEFAIDCGERLAVLAMDEKLERGAIGVVDFRHPEAPLALVLKPLVELRFTFDAKPEGVQPHSFGAWPFPVSARFSYVGKCISATKEFRFRLPAGDYEIAYSTDTFGHEPGVSSGVIATLERDAVDLGAVHLDLSPVVHVVGRVVDGGDPVAGVEVATHWYARM